MLLLVASATACVTPPAEGATWRLDPVWDDGNAEFCAYEVDWQRYGRANPGSAQLVAVKEPWAPDLQVKADSPRPDGFEVIKLNHVRDVPTGIYTYHQMASTFIRRDSGALQKLAVTSSEGCGISTAQMVGGRLSTHSYFDGQGDRTVDYPIDAVPFDGLALTLRDHLIGPLPRQLEVFPTLMTGRFPDLVPTGYRLERREGETTVPAGTFRTIDLELTSGAHWLRFAFDALPPHPLVRYEDDGGTSYRLAKCERIPYWRMNGPKGEEWLPQALR